MAQKKKLQSSDDQSGKPDTKSSPKKTPAKTSNLAAKMAEVSTNPTVPPPIPATPSEPSSSSATAKKGSDKSEPAKAPGKKPEAANEKAAEEKSATKSKLQIAEQKNLKLAHERERDSERKTGPLPFNTLPEPPTALDGTGDSSDDNKKTSTAQTPQRRPARRRAAGPVRGRIAANDDAPSIGGLIYALEQKPTSKPFKIAGAISLIWALLGLGFAAITLSADLDAGMSFADVLRQPTTFLTFAAITVPIAVVWFLALLAWRAEELRLRSSTMTEVAVRLAEPDRLAEQSVATLGQAVRRQVSFMNDAVSRALGRAGELEALVHNEVSALEHSYEENERKIRNLIDELAGERNALLTTSERVTDNLRTLGTEVPTLIEKLSTQQIKLAQIIQGAGDNLTALEDALGSRTDRLESVLEDRTGNMQNLLSDYTGALAAALSDRTEQIQVAFEESMQTLDTTIGNRTDNLQAVFEEYARALDTTLASRAQALDVQLVERTRALDDAFSDRLRLFDAAIKQSTTAIDEAVGDRAMALNDALENHAKTFRETISLQAADLDDSLAQGINSVRRSSENITRQSIKAIEGLANQSDMLKNVSENLLNQINSVTNRFDSQGTSIMKAANALEAVNYKIDSTLQNRHQQLTQTLSHMTDKAEEFGDFVKGYSTSIEGSLTEAEKRARQTAEELRRGAEQHQQAALADMTRLRQETDAQSNQALQDLRNRFSSVSSEFTSKLGSLSSQFEETSEQVRQRAAETARDIAVEKARIQKELAAMPASALENSKVMRKALQDQLRALDELSNLTERQARARDVSAPSPSAETPQIAARPAPRPGPYANTQADSTQPDPAYSTLSSNLARELVGQPSSQQPPAVGAHGHPPPPQPAQQRPASGPAAPAPGTGDKWSLGDLLQRASFDDEPHAATAAPAPPEPAKAPPPPTSAPDPQQQPLAIDVNVLARALNRPTAADIWARLRQGQRGIMVRSIYSPEGQTAYDEITRRYATDTDLQNTIGRYLSEFEQILKQAEQSDPSGAQTEEQLLSDMGRVYLFLAHASGRLA